jgi:NTE family protein
MGEPGNIQSATQRRAAVEAFRDLSQKEMAELEATLKLLSVPRGTVLVRQGDDTSELYIVVSGRFQVYVDKRAVPISEIGPGQPVGDIAFFCGGARTASAHATRDSLVLELTRRDFDRLAAQSPGIWRSITATMARRLADTTAGGLLRKFNPPRTIAVCQAGLAPIPQEFLSNFRKAFEARSSCTFLNSSTFPLACGHDISLDSSFATNWFNELEGRYEHVFYIADNTLTPWSEKAIRQADLVVSVGLHETGASGSCRDQHEVERFAYALHRPENLRLLLLHDNRNPIKGTRQWLDARPLISLHHHLVVRHLPDYERVARFIRGNALGLVACGGGAFSAAHVGLYQALREAGFEFDAMGGTSGGGAMTAAFALGANTDEIDRRIDDVFVKQRALGHWTWPRYGLLDHAVLDRALMEHYAGIDIEDLWIPYFAISTNLSRNDVYYHRRGRLWEAVRATSALPALLPPFYTNEGEMLVDGSLLDNVPVSAMRSIKTGPNVVISFELRGVDRFDLKYRDIPSRTQLIRRMLNPFSKRSLPIAPGPLAVLMRSLMIGRHDFRAEMEEGDLLLVPPIPSTLNALDWKQHTTVKESAYQFAVSELSRLKILGHPLVKEVNKGAARSQEQSCGERRKRNC